ncbi:MAG: hypothetical protein SWK76_06635 [Actinomycetota bacterium]|nr:hypothetical protein [Actinomycetota bacterium]
MGILNLFRKKPGDREVVFTGERMEAELVLRLLTDQGFHPNEWTDLPGPYTGPAGMARVVVPREEGEKAKEFLATLKDKPITDE